jgi:glycosyltransferase involved in cell wall biosynthesis
MVPVVRELARTAGLPPLELDDGRTVPWSEVKLVTVGEISPMYGRNPNVVQLAWVDDATRWHLLRGAVAVVNPSVYESLSLVLIEAWSVGRPVVVHRRCDVTVGQCRRSAGGIAIDFDRPPEGARQLAEALARRGARATMGEAGRAYVERRYDWDRVARAYESVALAVREGSDVATALSPWVPAEA